MWDGHSAAYTTQLYEPRIVENGSNTMFRNIQNIYYKKNQMDPNKSPMIEDGYCSIYIVLLIYKKNPGDQKNNYAIMVPKKDKICVTTTT